MRAKKILGLLFAAALAITALSACESNEAGVETTDTATSHEHSAVGAWMCDAAEHWQLCECGEVLNRAAHEIGDGAACIVCNSEIWDEGDGAYSVYSYNEHGELVRIASYDAQGNASEEYFREMEYDAEGNPLRAKIYYNGVFSEEAEYGPDADGAYFEIKVTYYTEDGCRTVNEYDTNGELVLMVSYDANDVKTMEVLSEYAVNADGDTYECRSTTVYYEMGQRYVSEYNEFEDQISVTTTDLDGNVIETKRTEYGYSEEREHTWKKVYVNDVLTEEVYGYITIETDDYTARVPECEIFYEADGSKKVVTPNDIGDTGTETYYNADGTVRLIVTYEYDFYEDGNRKSLRTYEDGRLVREAEYLIDEAYGWSYEAKVTEYGENGEVLSVTQFDTDGNEITG